MSSDAARGPRRNVRIGKYEVLSHIATGGMGAVYKARDTESGEEVALKVLSPEAAAKPSMIERFRREARHAAKLNHENIVTLHEFGEANRTFYLVMEFVDGIDLHEYSNRKGPLDPDEALDIILQACRALDHAFGQGVIHRDIKPSNFLISRRDGRNLVKLTDLGLAREASNEEFRVTRAGTTVGTLDYMSPEQARDSGLADVRSDLYSLGSTWYHLLAGHAPFPKGGLGERLHRILHEIPQDIRELNPRVPEAMAAVLHRLLAKKPSQRYQTPAELLRDLEALARGRQPPSLLEGNDGEAEKAPKAEPPRRKGARSADGRRTPHAVRTRRRPDTEAGKSTAETPTPGSRRRRPAILWYALAGVATLVLLVSLVVILSLRRGKREQPVAEQPPPAETQPDGPVVPPPVTPLPDPRPEPGDPGGDRELKTQPQKPTWPALYRPAEPVDLAALRREVEAPWAAAPAPAPTVELVVGRGEPGASAPGGRPPGTDAPGSPGKTFRTLAAACQAIPAGAVGVIELRDNGPFFDVGAAVADRGVVLRAGAGYRPLLVWDVPRLVDERRRRRDRKEPAGEEAAPALLSVRRGRLTLQDVHVALRWPDASSAGAAVLAVEDGDLTVTGCTFSVAGKPRDGLSVVRFTATRAEAGRCRLSRCHVRAGGASALELSAPGARVLVEDSLLVGGEPPLVEVRAANERATDLGVVRSTLVAGTTLVRLRPAGRMDHDPAFRWLGWDALLSRQGREAGGELLRLEGDADTRRAGWRAVNCLYAGWDKLLAGPSVIPATDVSGWRRLWGRIEGDVARDETWPTTAPPEPAEVPASAYRTAGTPVAFAASTGSDRLLGCPVEELSPAREGWLPLTFDRFAVLAPTPPEDAGPPEIPPAADGLYHGERLDLSRVDLGAYLLEVQRTLRLAPRVVLHLAGAGEVPTTPIRLKGSSLVLYFEPAADKAEPLTLVPAPAGAGEALIDVEDGSLEVMNGALHFAEGPKARALPWLVRVRGGDVRLFRAHLEVPPREKGNVFRGLLSLAGSGDASAERVRTLAANESVLISPRGCVSWQGVGGRVVLTQSLLIAGGDALDLALDPGFAGKANLQCVLDHTTFAARGAVLHQGDVAARDRPAEPVVVQTRECAYLNPFGLRARPGWVRYDGTALARGLLVWQGEGDAFDRRLWFAAAAAVPEKPDDRAAWFAPWGSPGLRRAVLDVPLFRNFEGERWSAERLLGLKLPAGANVERLAALRKSKKGPR